MNWYIYTLDSRDCFGPFASFQMAKGWALSHKLPVFQVLSEVPYKLTTLVLKPF